MDSNECLVLWSWSFGPGSLVLVLWSWAFGPGPLVLVSVNWYFDRFSAKYQFTDTDTNYIDYQSIPNNVEPNLIMRGA